MPRFKIFKMYHPQLFIGIWGISQMPGYLGNLPNSWVSGQFPKCLGSWEIPQISSHLRNFQNLKLYHPQIPKGIWGISQMPVYLGNFPIVWVSGKFPKCLGI